MKRKLNLKLVLGLLGGLFVIGIGVHFLHGYQLRENAYRLLDRADKARAAKDLDKAEFYYEQYLSFVPDDADAVHKLAQILDARAESVGDRVRVVLLTEQVLRLKPNEQELRIRLVHHLITLDRIPEAIDSLRKLERTWRDRAEILHMLGWCLDAKKDYVPAVKALEEAIRVNPKQLKSYAILAEVLQDRLSQPDDALKVIDDLVRANADSYQAYLSRARFHQRRGDDKLADEDLQRAFKLAPDRPEVIYAVADAARAKGNWVEAERLLNDALKRFPDQADFYRLMVNVHLETKNQAQALKVLQDGVKHAPNANELAVLMIDLMIDRQQYQEAQTRIDELRQTGIRPALPNYLTARLRIADRKWKEASTLLESVRDDLGPASPWKSRVHVLLGTLAEREGKYQQAIQDYTRALDLGAMQPRVLVRLLELLIERREFDKAEAELSRYEEKWPLTRELARLGAEVSLGLRDAPEKAVTRAEQAVSLPARDYRDALWLAHVYQAAEENAKAEALLRDTLAQASHAPDAWVAWLEHLANTNQRDAAVRDLERMKKELPANRRALALARAYEAIRLPAEADAAYQTSLRNRPGDFVLLAFAADFYRRADRHEEARKWYERLLDPALAAPAESTLKARRHLAILLAASAPARALDLLAANKRARGDTIADERARFFVESQTASARQAAIGKFQDSLRLQMPTPDERVLLAQMLDAAGFPGEARTQLAEAVAEAPTAAEYLARYIRLLIRAEEWDQAQRQLARLETLEPASARLRELKQLLARQK